jgi:hypothetical protein
MVQTGHAAAVMAAAASDGERLARPLPLVVGFWGRGKTRPSRSRFARFQNAGGDDFAAGRTPFTFLSLFPFSPFRFSYIVFPEMLTTNLKFNPAADGTQAPGPLYA